MIENGFVHSIGRVGGTHDDDEVFERDVSPRDAGAVDRVLQSCAVASSAASSGRVLGSVVEQAVLGEDESSTS
jgi:hypothetical protein